MKRLIVRVRLWVLGNHLAKRLRKLQHMQAEDQLCIVKEVKDSKHRMTSELSEAIFKLSAVSDSLEDALRDMGADD